MPVLATGTVYVRWKQICQKYGWSDALCGPCVMAFNENTMEGNCCYNHPKGCKLHIIPQTGGKKFVIREHQKELNDLKLTEVREELKAEKAGNKKPPGEPKKVNGVDIYPTRSFA